MKQQPTKRGLKQKISNYFKFLCSGNSQIHSQVPNGEMIASANSKIGNKKKRLTFLIDRAIVKLSRKNIVLEQFQSNNFISQGLQALIAKRVSIYTIVLFAGSFSDKAMKCIACPIIINSTQQNSFKYSNRVLANIKLPFKLRKNTMDCFVQVIFSNVEKLLITLQNYHQNCQNFIFVMEKYIEIQALHGVFVLFKDVYMFEIERIMEVDKCLATILYVSASPQFLLIDNQSIADFYVSQMVKKDQYIQKFDLSSLIGELLELGLYVEVASTIGQLLIRKQVQEMEKEFAHLMKERYPASRNAVEGFENGMNKQIKQSSQIMKVPTFHENTPLFGKMRQKTIKIQKQVNLLDKKYLQVTQERLPQHSFGGGLDHQ